jgi:hypothetical protein
MFDTDHYGTRYILIIYTDMHCHTHRDRPFAKIDSKLPKKTPDDSQKNPINSSRRFAETLENNTTHLEKI